MSHLHKRVANTCTDNASRVKAGQGMGSISHGRKGREAQPGMQPGPVMVKNDGMDELFSELIEALDEVSGEK